MNFSFSEEQNQFRDVVRRFMQDKSPASAVREIAFSSMAFDQELWRALHEDLGVLCLQLPDSYGGGGFGVTELSIVAEEMGRALCCAPYLSSCVIAAETVSACATENYREDLLPKLASGRRIGALAVADEAGHWRSTVKAADDGVSTRLNGTSHFVVGGMEADLLLVIAHGAKGEPHLYAVDAAAVGLQRRGLNVLDPTRPQAEIIFDQVEGERISDGTSIEEPLTRVYDRAMIFVANEMIGGAQRLLDMSVEYAGVRMQFGRTIGSFQAIKHKCADMLLDVELSRSAAYYAAAAADENDAELSALASLSLASAAETYMRTATECIQIHGGIGFTWDHDAHLWFRRAKSSEVLLGTPDQHRERYLELSGACA